MSNVAVLEYQHLSNTKSNKISTAKSNKISTASEIKRNILDLSDERCRLMKGVSAAKCVEASAGGRCASVEWNPESFQPECACVNVETAQRGTVSAERH